MAKKLELPKLEGDLLMLRIARQLAMDQHPLEKILEMEGVDFRDFKRMERMPRFQQYLQDEIKNWNSATNTSERVKIKAAAMIEEWLPEAFAQMHNESAPLLHRTDLSKLVARLGGMDKGDMAVGAGGERFSVTINLGSDQKLNFNKEVPSKVIEGTVND